MAWRRAIAIWLLIIVAESVHGTLRQLWLAPAMGDLPARRVGVIVGAAMIFLIAFAFARWLGLRTTGSLLQVGAVWMLLTVVFEVALGRWVFHYDWDRMALDYDLRRGGLMGLGLLGMLVIPLAAARLRLGRRAVR